MPINFGPLITFADCVRCRKCCTFNVDELAEAPIFTDQQRELAIQVADSALTFDRRGDFWQLRLTPADRADRWVCPLLEPESGACKVQADKPLNCSIYPAHAVTEGDRPMLAITNVCPIINDDNGQLKPGIDEYTRKRLDGPIGSLVERNPEVAIPFRQNDMTAITFLNPQSRA